MKKIIIFLILLTLFILNLGLVKAGQEVFLYDPDLRIDLVSITPSPVQEGQEFNMVFRIKNFGTKDIRDLNIKLAEKFPFSLIEGESSTRSFSVIKSGSSATISYNLYVNSYAGEISRKISLQLSAPSFSRVYSSTFEIDVVGIENIISIDKVISDPPRIRPGETAKLMFELQNNGEIAMREISVNLDFGNVPLSPVFSTDERRVSFLNVGREVQLEFDIIADADAKSKTHKVPVEITYYDVLGSKITKNHTLGVLVYSEPEFEVNLEDTEVYKKGETGEVTVSISNEGPSDIKFLTIEILESKYYKTISTKRIYLGNLDSDDFETAQFNIYTKKRGDVPLKFRIKYKDTYNKDFIEERLVILPIYSSFAASTYGLSKGTGILKIIFYILLLVYIYLSFKAWRIKRNIPAALKIGLKKLILGIIKIISSLRPSKLKKMPGKIKKFLKS